MDVEMFDRAVKTTHGAVAGISRDQLDGDTPCTDWSVRDLLNHLIGSYEAVATGAAGEVLDPMATDYTAGDYVAAYEAASRRAREAFALPGALEKTFAMPWGEIPGQIVLGLMIADAAVHGWDLARATNQEYAPDDDVAEAIYEMTTGMMEPRGKFPRGT
ncbi:MAG TPA: TIGR03086 family metal-binding protein, partial [Actinomycetota bacterium]|nr:TIGR03086 family metal-binding protein [Actinomycetota bacterium]